ncbi:NADH-dependent alcohol dehydrogenase, partial [Francisella tularensis]|nr:NADH-dependent alcohol dehydrogenase [Francisella tularensis]
MKFGAYFKKHHIDIILTVGMESVKDADKSSHAAAKFDGEPWDILIKAATINICKRLG